MSVQSRIENLVKLGVALQDRSEEYDKVSRQAKGNNGWFTHENIDKAITNICASYLDRQHLETWVSKYALVDNKDPKTVALITAGNIPLVGIHDMISIYISGHQVAIKPSSKDKPLTEYVIGLLKKIDPKAPIEVISTLDQYDAVITTSTNSNATTFEYYFRHVPNIIRRNRNSIALFYGNETEQDFIALAPDIFDYFGLGCRNVSAMLFPTGFDIESLMRTIDEHVGVIDHNKYINNYDYNNAIFILNKEEFLINKSMLLRKHESLASRIATIHFQYYDTMDDVIKIVNENKEKIQCIVSQHEIKGVDTFRFGQAQSPALWDYADGVDTLDFLQKL